MKLRFITILIGLLGGALLWTPTPKADMVFDVTTYGAKGDCTYSGSTAGCTNDVVAIRKAIAAANANGGGRVYFPRTSSATSVYYQTTGDPAVDTNLTSIDANHKAVWNITSNDVTFQFAPGVSVRHVSTYLYQTNTGGGTIPGQEFLFYFGNGVTIIEDFKLEGNWANFKFEVAAPAAYFTGDNSANGFLFVSGKQKRNKWREFYVDGFPQIGLIDGYSSGSDQKTDTTFEDMRVLEYGSGGDDLSIYTYGYTSLLRCWFMTTRKSSHGVYWGATKPRVVIDSCYFKGQDESAALNNKFGIQMYQTSGTDPIRDALVQNCVFDDVRNPIWIEHVGGYNTRNIRILNNYFLRSGGTSVGTGIQAQQSTGCDISGNWFQRMTAGVSILSSGAGTQNNVSSNWFYDCDNGFNLNVSYSTIANNHYLRSAITTNGSSRLIVTGAYNTVDGNELVDGGSSGGSPVGLIVNGTGNRVVNGVVRSTASQTYSIIYQIISNQGYVAGNYIDHTGSGYSDISGDEITVLGNQSNKLTIVNGTGSNYSQAVANTQYASSQMRLTGKVRPLFNSIGGGWETITGAVGGLGNLTSNANYGSIAVTTSGTYNPNVGVYQTFLLTANGNLTLGSTTGAINGLPINFIILQDATGGRTITFDATYYKISCSPSTTANLRTSISFVYDSSLSKFVQVGSCLSGF